jgi:hypothetical protein
MEQAVTTKKRNSLREHPKVKCATGGERKKLAEQRGEILEETDISTPQNSDGPHIDASQNPGQTPHQFR